MPLQFSNPANPEAHFRSTGPEIWTDTGGEIDAFVCGVGTGGTITGVARYLKEQGSDASITRSSRPRHRSFPVAECGPHRIQGIGAGFVPEVLDMDLIDEMLPVSDDDALRTARQPGREGRNPRRDLGRGERSRGAGAGRPARTCGRSHRHRDLRQR